MEITHQSRQRMAEHFKTIFIMNKEQLFKNYNIDESHSQWNDMIDNWMSIEVFRVMNGGRLPGPNDLDSRFITDFLDKMKNDSKFFAEIHKRDDWGSLFLTAKRMVYRHAEWLIDFDPSMHMMALTWKQPFAALMLHGKIETRTWPTKYRGWVLICAGKAILKSNQIKEMSGNAQGNRAIMKIINEQIIEDTGNAIAIGKLIDCRPMTPEDADACFVAYRQGLWCHVYSNVKAIEPIPWKGAQGWRNVPDEVKRQIKIIS